MACQSEQEEEAEVLLSIYEGDSCFRQVSPTKYHYRYGEENTSKNFVVELSWGENYPNEIPEINLELFGNNHILTEIKDSIKNGLAEQAENNTGMPMTYTLFEWLKENAETFTSAQPERSSTEFKEEKTGSPEQEQRPLKEAKKEKLTKAQKRKLAGRVVQGELPRGHDWVDVIKHLLQSGGVGSSG